MEEQTKKLLEKTMDELTVKDQVKISVVSCAVTAGLIGVWVGACVAYEKVQTHRFNKKMEKLNNTVNENIGV